MFSLILYFCISPLSFSFPYNFTIMSDSYFIIVENQSITNTTTKHPTNPTNHGIIKDRKFTLFFRSRIIAVIIMANHANIINPSKQKINYRTGQNLKNQKSFPPYGFFLLSNRAETAWNNKNAPLMSVITSSNCDKTDMELSL